MTESLISDSSVNYPVVVINMVFSSQSFSVPGTDQQH